MKFSEKLQMLRKEKGYSQEKLADLLEVSRQSVSKWESGTTYPEMDKLLAICKIFNVTLDDLTNDNVNKSEIANRKKNNFSNLVYTILDMFDKSIDMFKNMDSKTRKQFLRQFIFLVIILLILKIPFNYVEYLFSNLFVKFNPTAYSILFGITSFLINIIYFVLFLCLLIYFYKSRYLDKYDETKVLESNDDSKEVEKEKESIKEEIKPIKEQKSFILFDILGAIFNVCIKICLFFISLFFIGLFIAFAFSFVFSIIILLKGVSIFGLSLILLACTIGSFVFLDLNITWLFSKKIKFKLLLILFFITLILFGSGTAIFASEITKYKYIDSLPKDTLFVTDNYEFAMQDNLVFNIDDYRVTYKENNELQDKVKLDVTYTKNYIDILVKNTNNEIDVNTYETVHVMSVFNDIIANLKNKELYNYDFYDSTQFVIETSKENIEILKNNYDTISYEALERIEEEEYEGLEKEIERLEEENERLKEKQDEYKEKISDLEDKISEYKASVREVLDN